MPPCLTLSIIRYRLRVSGTIQEKEKHPTLYYSVVAIEKGASSCPWLRSAMVNSQAYVFLCIHTWQLLRLNRRQLFQCSSPPSPHLLGGSLVTPKPSSWAKQIFGKWWDKNDPEQLTYLFFDGFKWHKLVQHRYHSLNLANITQWQAKARWLVNA